MKIALQDKKVLGAFLKRSSFEGRVLVTDGDELRGTWGDRPLVAKWDKFNGSVWIKCTIKFCKALQLLQT